MLFDQMDKDKNGTVDKPEFVAVASRDEQIVSSLASNISSVARVEQSAQEFTTFDQQVFFFFFSFAKNVAYVFIRLPATARGTWPCFRLETQS